MALHIKDPNADRLARKLAEQTGETLTETVIKALEERLARQGVEDDREKRFQRIMAIVTEVSKLPVLDDRPADELLGYNDIGVWD